MWEPLPPELIKDVFLRMITFLLNNGLYLGHTWLLRSCKLSKLESSCLNYISGLGIQGKVSPLKLQEQVALPWMVFVQVFNTEFIAHWLLLQMTVMCTFLLWLFALLGIVHQQEWQEHAGEMMTSIGGNYPMNRTVMEAKVTVKPSNHRCQVSAQTTVASPSADAEASHYLIHSFNQCLLGPKYDLGLGTLQQMRNLVGERFSSGVILAIDVCQEQVNCFALSTDMKRFWESYSWKCYLPS